MADRPDRMWHAVLLCSGRTACHAGLPPPIAFRARRAVPQQKARLSGRAREHVTEIRATREGPVPPQHEGAR